MRRPDVYKRQVLVTAAGSEPAKAPAKDASAPPSGPSVIRVRGGDLKYSDAERKAVMRGAALGSVVAETGTATSVSGEVELLLLPSGNHAGKDGGQTQVDRMTARGSVIVTSEGRRGTGEQLVYWSETGEYVLTGTAANPPRMTDPCLLYTSFARLSTPLRALSPARAGARTKDSSRPWCT